VGAIGVAATFLLVGVGYAAVVGYGFFNPAFREMDHVERERDTPAAQEG
jgi:hypothetical protein